MPTLKQVLPPGVDQAGVAAFLDVEVIAVKLNNGAPCSSHEGPFAAWPGEGEHVRQWFVLANGKAVALDEDPAGGPVIRMADVSAD